MLSKVGHLLLQLHRDCRLPAVDDFPHWAMELAQPAIPLSNHERLFTSQNGGQERPPFMRIAYPVLGLSKHHV